MSRPDDRAARAEARVAVGALHAEIERACAPLRARHAERLACRLGCTACCTDDLTVFEVEAERIVFAHADLLEHGEPHPPGACAFLAGDGACRIYDVRPQVCRTQGLPLRWWVEDGEGEIVERRSICELNVAGPEIESLPEDACWQIGPAEDRLIRLQAGIDGEGVTRVPLRSLFRSTSRGT